MRWPEVADFVQIGAVAGFWQTEGTPHWLAFAPGGELLRSVYGSQEGAQTRLAYLLGEWVGKG